MENKGKENANNITVGKNGVPTPRGKPFTSETAREARQKRTEKERTQRSITKAFIELMAEEHTDAKGKTYFGDEIIARAVMTYAAKGNPRMVEIALAMMGETPPQKITIQNGQLEELIQGLKEPCEYDIHS